MKGRKFDTNVFSWKLQVLSKSFVSNNNNKNFFVIFYSFVFDDVD